MKTKEIKESDWADKELAGIKLRQLNEWIASNIFMFYVHYEGKVPYISQFKKPDWNKKYGTLPEYTTDPSPALDVLKKCGEILWPAFTSTRGQPVKWIYTDRITLENKTVETLELAICLFAKQLFSK